MSLVATVLVGSSLLIACSSDEGKPSDGTSSGTLVGAPTSAPTGTPTSTPTGSSTGTPPAGTKKALLEGCVKDDDCTSGVCYAGDQGSYCSLKCTAENAATVCVAPMAGTCNKKGFCKKP